MPNWLISTGTNANFSNYFDAGSTNTFVVGLHIQSDLCFNLLHVSSLVERTAPLILDLEPFLDKLMSKK